MGQRDAKQILPDLHEIKTNLGEFDLINVGLKAGTWGELGLPFILLVLRFQLLSESLIWLV